MKPIDKTRHLLSRQFRWYAGIWQLPSREFRGDLLGIGWNPSFGPFRQSHVGSKTPSTNLTTELI